jgi:hypothetical protein
MQTSQGFLVMLVLITSTLAPVLSTPLGWVVVPFISCDTADLVVVLVAPALRKCAPLRNLSIVTASHRLQSQSQKSHGDEFLFFLLLLGSGQCTYVW